MESDQIQVHPIVNLWPKQHYVINAALTITATTTDVKEVLLFKAKVSSAAGNQR